MSDHDRIQTRSMSRQNSLQSGVENITRRIDRVSTSEIEEASSPKQKRRHRSSTTEPPSTKKIRQRSGGATSKQDVKLLTKAVFESLLITATSASPTRKHGSPKRKRGKARGKLKRSPIACTFTEPREVGGPKRAAAENVQTGPPSLAFPSDIEADGSGPSSLGAHTNQPESEDPTDEKRREVKELGAELRRIGDAVDKEVRDRIIHFAVDIVKKKAYDKYTDTLEQLLDLSDKQVTDPTDRYKVALVWLLTEIVVTRARNASVSEGTLKNTLDSAAAYISDKFPSWLE